MDLGYILVGLIVLFLLIWVIKTINKFKTGMEEVLQSKSGIDIALESRYDTLTKLKETVKGYAAHEYNTLMQVTELRKGMSIKEMAQVEQQMQTAFSQINAVAEQYPDLKASANFLMLQDQIVAEEKSLSVARRVYNSAVTEFNKQVVSIPSCLIAPLASAKRQDFFEATATKRNDVDMSF